MWSRWDRSGSQSKARSAALARSALGWLIVLVQVTLVACWAIKEGATAPLELLRTGPGTVPNEPSRPAIWGLLCTETEYGGYVVAMVRPAAACFT